MARIIVFLGLDNDPLLAAARAHLVAHPSHKLTRWPECRGIAWAVPPAAPRLDLLHPSLHGAVADKAIAHTAPPSAPMVVVTHSDVFVLRLRRRIADGSLRPEDVDLNWVEADGTEKPIPLNDRGTPAWWPEWPRGSAELEEFHALRRALAARRDTQAVAARETLPTCPEDP